MSTLINKLLMTTITMIINNKNDDRNEIPTDFMIYYFLNT